MTLPGVPPPTLIPDEPLVVQEARVFRELLLAREADQIRLMYERWVTIENTLDAEIYGLINEISDLQAKGMPVGPSKIKRLERYQRLLVQAQEQITGYNEWTSDLTMEGQRQLSRWGIEHSSALINAVYLEAGEITPYFDQLNVAAVQNIVGVMADGTTVYQHLQTHALPGALDGMTDSLIKAVALGYNPNKTARMMKDGLAGGLFQARAIARTEQLRAYRYASQQNYAASGVVEGYIRISARDTRVCRGCLAADGDFYKLDVFYKAHPQCRCGLIPKVKNIKAPYWESAESWLKRQPVDVQQKILGKGGYDRFVEGVDFKRFAVVRKDSTWGDSIVPRPLKDL